MVVQVRTYSSASLIDLSTRYYRYRFGNCPSFQRDVRGRLLFDVDCDARVFSSLEAGAFDPNLVNAGEQVINLVKPVAICCNAAIGLWSRDFHGCSRDRRTVLVGDKATDGTLRRLPKCRGCHQGKT